MTSLTNIWVSNDLYLAIIKHPGGGGETPGDSEYLLQSSDNWPRVLWYEDFFVKMFSKIILTLYIGEIYLLLVDNHERMMLHLMIAKEPN